MIGPDALIENYGKGHTSLEHLVVALKEQPWGTGATTMAEDSDRWSHLTDLPDRGLRLDELLADAEIDGHITAMTRAQLARVGRVVGITGGPRRTTAIRAALTGRWLNVLITDHFTAQRLLAS